MKKLSKIELKENQIIANSKFKDYHCVARYKRCLYTTELVYQDFSVCG